MIPNCLHITAAQAASHYEVCYGGVTVSCAPGRDPVVLDGVRRRIGGSDEEPVMQTVSSAGTVEPGIDEGWWIVPAKYAEDFAQAVKAEIAKRLEAAKAAGKPSGGK